MFRGHVLAAISLAIGGPLAALAAHAAAADHHVSPGQSVQAAINGALDGDRVLVHPGTYPEAIDFLGKDLEVIGIGGATATTLDATALNASVVTLAANEPKTARLVGFRLTGGSGTPGPLGSLGGGVYAGDTYAKVVSCWITGNSVTRDGGGVYGGWFESCLIENNQAAGSGGGAARGSLTRCVLRANLALNGGGFSDCRLRDCEVSGNDANLGGGGHWTLAEIVIEENPLELLLLGPERCTFRGNKATQDGGGLYAYVQYGVAVRRCRFLGNQAGGAGGGAYVKTLTHSVFGGSVELDACVMSGNQAPLGRGAALSPDALFGGTAVLTSCTLDGDDAHEVGSGGLLVRGCVSINEANPFVTAATLTIENSDVPAALVGGGAGNISAPPLLVDPAADDHHLTAPSPCRDGGHWSSANEADVEGDLRDATPDMGADEFRPHVYFDGDPAPGGVVRLGFAGPPGAPPLLFLGSSLLEVPVATAKGLFRLGGLVPGFPILLPPLPATGSLVLAGALPPALPILIELHAQAYLGGSADTLTDAASLLVR